MHQPNNRACQDCSGKGDDKQHSGPDGTPAACEGCDGYGDKDYTRITHRVLPRNAAKILPKLRLLLALVCRYMDNLLYSRLHQPQTLDDILAEQLNSYQPHTVCRRAVARVINDCRVKGLLPNYVSIQKVAQASDGLWFSTNKQTKA
jgi:hypothetical protein